MNLGDVTEKTVPKMILVAPPRDGGTICTRSFIPTDYTGQGCFHVSVGTGCVILDGGPTVGEILKGDAKLMSVEHPTGEFSVEMEIGDRDGLPKIKRAALLRTARRLFEGNASFRPTWAGPAPGDGLAV